MLRATLLPLKLLGRCIEIALILATALLIALGIICFSRSTKPMLLTDAKGITYIDFIADREDAFDPNGTDLEQTVSVGLPTAKAFLVSIPTTSSILLPGAGIDHWFPNTDLQEIRGEIEKDSNIPLMYWRVFERANWQYLVTDRPDVQPPALPDEVKSDNRN